MLLKRERIQTLIDAEGKSRRGLTRLCGSVPLPQPPAKRSTAHIRSTGNPQHSDKRFKSRGSTLLEAALFIPFLVMLLLGLIEFGRITYTYYAVQKAMYNFARFASTQQAINFCDNGDPALTRARSLAITGSGSGEGDPLILGLEAANLRIRIERYDVSSDSLVECDCSSNGCDTAQGGGPPGFVTVDLENGYPVQLRLLGLTPDPILLRPSVRVPFGGT